MTDELPSIPGWIQNGFHGFLPRYFRRHFDLVAVDPDDQPDAATLAGGPLLVVANHPSWWDPLTAHLLNRRLLGPRQFRAPIDAAALAQYGVFEKLGFFGIESGSSAGAKSFLRSGKAAMRSSRDALWVTPEGRFADVRDDQADLSPGIAHLAAHAQSGHAIAVAMEYAFWNERLPIVAVRFSPPLSLSPSNVSKQQWLVQLTQLLRETQRNLASKVIRRDATLFEPLIAGRGGAGCGL